MVIVTIFFTSFRVENNVLTNRAQKERPGIRSPCMNLKNERDGETKKFEALHTDLTLAPLSTQKVPSGTTSSHARRIVVPLETFCVREGGRDESGWRSSKMFVSVPSVRPD